MHTFHDVPLGDGGLGLTDVAAGLISGAITVAGGLATMGIGAAATKKQQERASAQERRLLQMRQQHEKDMTEMMLTAQTQQMQVPASYPNVPQPGMIPGSADLTTQLQAAQDASRLAQQQVGLDEQAAALQQQQQMMLLLSGTAPPAVTIAEKQKKERRKRILKYAAIGLGGAVVVGGLIYLAVGK